MIADFWIKKRRKFQDLINEILFIDKWKIIKVCLNTKKDFRQSSLTYLCTWHTILSFGHRIFVSNNGSTSCECVLQYVS